MINIIGDFISGYILPGIVLFCIIVVYCKTKKRNIAYNSIGFLLIMLSIAMGGATNFADVTVQNNFVLSDAYKFVTVIAGLLGTAVCAVVAFKDQASS